MRRWTFLLCLAGCVIAGNDDDTGMSGGPSLTLLSNEGGASESSGPTGGATTGGATTGGAEDAGAGSSGGAGGESTSTGEGGTTDALPPAIACTYPATNYAGGMLELMVPKGSNEQLVFTVPDLPAPELVSEAQLKFVSWDADHPGQEGVIVVNGGPAIDLPADPAWENAEHATTVDVSGQTVAGANTVAFGAGSFVDGSFYRIGQVAIAATVHVDACPQAPERPAKPVQIDYPDASYTQRHNWVFRCDFIPPYAYTAGSPHPGEDCEDLYMPDTSSAGTATFTFEDLPAATYRITIQARHSANRNPKGALFIVDGEGRRVDQTVGSEVVVDEWGTKFLTGTIDVVLDSSLDSESDSVAWVRLEPV